MKIKLLPLVLLTLSQGLLAQQIPGAGSQLKQLPPPPPTPLKTAPDMRIEEATPATAPGSDAVKVLVRELRVTGASAYSPAELIAITRFTPGSELTLAQLQAMATLITEHYRSNGYFVARA